MLALNVRSDTTFDELLGTKSYTGETSAIWNIELSILDEVFLI